MKKYIFLILAALLIVCVVDAFGQFGANNAAPAPYTKYDFGSVELSAGGDSLVIAADTNYRITSLWLQCETLGDSIGLRYLIREPYAGYTDNSGNSVAAGSWASTDEILYIMPSNRNTSAPLYYVADTLIFRSTATDDIVMSYAVGYTRYSRRPVGSAP